MTVIPVSAIITALTSAAVALQTRGHQEDGQQLKAQATSSGDISAGQQLVEFTVSEQFTWREQVPEATNFCPSLFVAIFSKRDSFEKRSRLRAVWKNMKGWGLITAGFAVCDKHADENTLVSATLSREEKEHGDVLFLDCEEGYKHGLLTQKVVVAMKLFLERYNHALFMKVDDDTFFSAGRMCDILSSHFQAYPQALSYVGVYAEKGETFGELHPPCRDPASEWYEPEVKFNRGLFPISAKGGPGYILSRAMVSEIVEQKIADTYLLNNEDKAVGVWVNELLEQGKSVTFLNVPGTDGYLRYHDDLKLKGRWSHYPYVVHHNLGANTIRCLHETDVAGNPDARVDKCFQMNGQQYLNRKANQ